MKYDIVPLSALCKSGGSYGIGASAVEYSSDLPTYLRITDINDDGTLNMSDLKSVDAPNSYKYKLEPNDIVFARTGASTGRNYFYDGRDGEFVYAGFLIKFSIDPQKVNPKYIKYYCASRDYFDWIDSFNTGSTRGNMNAKTLESMPIPLLPKGNQDLLVATLSCLDDKIELNNKINANLEAQAQAIFKSWFVDFEPFQDGEFVDSELGMIPKGWRVGALSELISVKYGKDHKKLADGDIPVYGSGGIMRYAESALYNKESVLIPRKGTLNNVIYINDPFWTVDTMFYTEMRIPHVAKYVFFFVSNQDLASMNAGSAVPSMTTDILNSLPVIIAPEDVYIKYDNLVSPMFNGLRQGEKENHALAVLRDTLLPKLMSGEIEVPRGAC